VCAQSRRGKKAASPLARLSQKLEARREERRRLQEETYKV
jgi:hypothetical protein